MIDPRRWRTEPVPRRGGKPRRPNSGASLVRPPEYIHHGWSDEVGLGQSWDEMPEISSAFTDVPAMEQTDLLASSWGDMPEIAPGRWGGPSTAAPVPLPQARAQPRSGNVSPAHSGGASTPAAAGGGIYDIAFDFDQPYTTPWAGGPPRHRGVDLVVPGAKDNGRGSPVTAFQPGRVVAVTQDPHGGNGVILQGEDGLYHRYFHFDAINVRQGQYVDSTTPIGILGASGTEGFPHVHFEVSRGING